MYQIPDFQESYQYFAWNNLVLGTQFNIGLAVGDWKKSPTAPLCDVIFCYKSVKDQFKVQIANFALSWKKQIARTEIVYERAFGKTPLSVQAELGLSLNRREIYYGSEFVDMSAVSALALRYYFLETFKTDVAKAAAICRGHMHPWGEALTCIMHRRRAN